MMYQKLFSLQEETLKVLANQKRLEIVQLLKGRELAVSEMMEMLGVPQANLSQHLSMMRQAKIVETRREGVKIFYSLTDDRIAEACSILKEFLKDQYKSDAQISKILTNDQSNPYPIVKDVVCGMRISVSEAGGQEIMAGETYYFCASGCKEKFCKNPSKYARAEAVK
jgi:ArsR family transcriptional regulator, virulence genes transcriptional regulator